MMDVWLYLKVSPDGIASTDLDSCKVVHGRFNFYGAIDSTCMAQLYMGDTRVMPLVIEASTVTVSIRQFRSDCLRWAAQ